MKSLHSIYNNKIIKNKDLKVDVFNASYFYGINVFEVIFFKYIPEKKVFYGFRIKDHFLRLKKSAKRLEIKNILTYDQTKKNIFRLIKKNKIKNDFTLKITIFLNGDGSWSGFDNKKNTILFSLKKQSNYGNNQIKRVGVSTIIKFNNSLYNSNNKCGANYLLSRYALIEARQKKFQNIIFLDKIKNITETTNSNIFIIKKNIFYTPPLSRYILDGITRKTLISLIKKLKFKIIIKNINIKKLNNVDEIFFTSTTGGITLCKNFNNKKLNFKKSLELQNYYNKIIAKKILIQNKWFEKYK